MTGNYEEKLSQETMRRNYHRKLWGEIITENYEEKLSQEITRRNYHRKLLASIYHHAKNVGIIGILAYSKIKSKRKRGNRRVILIEIKHLRIHNISVHKNSYQNRFINESDRKNFLKFS